MAEKIDYEEKEKKKKWIRRILVIIGIILLLLLLLRGCEGEGEIGKIFTDLGISDSQTEIKEHENAGNGTEYTEYVGYGMLDITKDNPTINLINPENNSVYMQFKVTYNGKELYSTDLIAPGKMDTFNIYKHLDSGQHTLIYEINTYDVDTKELCTFGITQEQEVNIIK